MSILDDARVNDPSLTPNAEVYEVLSPDPLNPDRPVRFWLDITASDSVHLSQRQPPWETYEEMFLDLADLVELGRIAQALIDEGHPPRGAV